MKKGDLRVRLGLRKDAVVRDTLRCIFCGKPETTREHIYPRWSHKFLLPSKKARNSFVIHRRYYNRIESATFNVKPLRDWQIKCVCADCNGVWMSQLETRLKPIMRPLILGRRARLSDADKEAIATWAILKVMVTQHRICSAEQRREMKKNQKPPDRWAVWIGTYDRKKWMQEWGSTPFRINVGFDFTPGGKRPPGWPANSHATTQIIKKLFIHVIHGPQQALVDGWRFTAPRVSLTGNLIKIWPPTGVGIRQWPQKALTDSDAYTATYVLLSSLMRIAEQQGLALPSNQIRHIAV